MDNVLDPSIYINTFFTKHYNPVKEKIINSSLYKEGFLRSTYSGKMTDESTSCVQWVFLFQLLYYKWFVIDGNLYNVLGTGRTNKNELYLDVKLFLRRSTTKKYERIPGQKQKRIKEIKITCPKGYIHIKISFKTLQNHWITAKYKSRSAFPYFYLLQEELITI